MSPAKTTFDQVTGLWSVDGKVHDPSDARFHPGDRVSVLYWETPACATRRVWQDATVLCKAPFGQLYHVHIDGWEEQYQVASSRSIR